MNFWFKVSFLPLMISISTANAIEADIEAGKAKASTACIACHGADGNSANPAWPKLAGQNKQYLIKQLLDFKSDEGLRKDPMMSGQAKMLSESDILNVASYLSIQTLKVGLAANLNGGQLYRSGNKQTKVSACVACHGVTGRGNDLAHFPRLAGQHATYIEKALKDFRSGTRTNDQNGMMQDIAKNLTDQEIKDIAQYIQGMK